MDTRSDVRDELLRRWPGRHRRTTDRDQRCPERAAYQLAGPTSAAMGWLTRFVRRRSRGHSPRNSPARHDTTGLRPLADPVVPEERGWVTSSGFRPPGIGMLGEKPDWEVAQT
jgi:hypothetical protein